MDIFGNSGPNCLSATGRGNAVGGPGALCSRRRAGGWRPNGKVMSRGVWGRFECGGVWGFGVRACP